MLRNAFDLIATEGTLRSILRMVSLARDTSDRLRVVMDNQPAVTLHAGSTSATMANAVNVPALWSSTSWNLVDARYDYGESLNGNAQANRSRWVIT